MEKRSKIELLPCPNSILPHSLLVMHLPLHSSHQRESISLSVLIVSPDQTCYAGKYASQFALLVLVDPASNNIAKVIQFSVDIDASEDSKFVEVILRYYNAHLSRRYFTLVLDLYQNHKSGLNLNVLQCILNMKTFMCLYAHKHMHIFCFSSTWFEPSRNESHMLMLTLCPQISG